MCVFLNSHVYIDLLLYRLTILCNVFTMFSTTNHSRDTNEIKSGRNKLCIFNFYFL